MDADKKGLHSDSEKNGFFPPKTFRPIYLTSFEIKTVWKVLDYYIATNVLRGNTLYPCRHGYWEIEPCAFLNVEGPCLANLNT